MEKRDLMARLIQLPGIIRQAEEHALLLTHGLRCARENLQYAEDGLLLSGAVQGKNEATRTAQVREQTVATRTQAIELEQSAARAQMELRFRQNEFSALKSIARLMAESGSEDHTPAR